MFFAAPTWRPGKLSVQVVDSQLEFPVLEMPTLPWLYLEGIDLAGQNCIVEVWIEKSTQNDWLVPLSRNRGVNLVIGIGEQSEIRSRELAMRAAERGVPFVVIYLSDFDPGGRSMPKAVARKVEFTILRGELNVELKVIPLALTPDQCEKYELPEAPLKESETRAGIFRRIFDRDATELDAMEALHPGVLAKLLNAELDNWLDRGLSGRVLAVQAACRRRLDAIEEEVQEKYAEELADFDERIAAIAEQLDALEEEAAGVWEAIAQELYQRRPNFSRVEIPRSAAPATTSAYVLFDSRRSYLEQIDRYNAWRDGAA